MTNPSEKMAKELYDHRNDPAEWSGHAVEAEVAKAPTEVVSFRLPPEELTALEQAAERVGETLSQYIRGALAIRLHGTAIGPAVEVTSGADRLLVRSHIVTSGRNISDAITPNFPPLTQSLTG